MRPAQRLSVYRNDKNRGCDSPLFFYIEAATLCERVAAFYYPYATMNRNRVNAPISPMAEDTTTSIESVVGHKDGDVLDSGEVVVFDYDEDGQFVGWHKGQGGK